MSYKFNEPRGGLTVTIDLRELLGEAAQMGEKLRQSSAGTAAIATQLYMFQAVPPGVILVWRDAHHAEQKFNGDSPEGKRLVFEAMTFVHYHLVVRALDNGRVMEQWSENGASPMDFVQSRELALRLFFLHEGMTSVSDIAEGGGATLDFDRRIDTYMKTGSRAAVDHAFIPYLEQALGCGRLHPEQEVEYRKIFHSVAAGADPVIDPTPRDVLVLSLSIGTDADEPDVAEEAEGTVTPDEPKADVSTERLVLSDDQSPHISETAFKSLLRSQPARKIRLWIVYTEDVYETVFGDGYYSYPGRAFFTKDTAEECARWVTQKSQEPPRSCGYRAEAKPCEVCLNDQDTLKVPNPQGVEVFNWEEIRLMELLNGTAPDWVRLMKYCLNKGEEEPRFADVLPASIYQAE